MTTLRRLHAKGALRREQAGRAHAYALATPLDALPASLTASRMRRLLDADNDRASVLASFIAHLDEDDERLLADLIDGRGRPADGDRPRRRSGYLGVAPGLASTTASGPGKTTASWPSA